MDSKQESRRTILGSSSLIGGASVLSLLIGLVKVKILAVFLGPAGIGLLGIYQNTLQVGSTFGSMGAPTVATRKIASVANSDEGVASSIASLTRFSILLAISGAVAVGLCCQWIMLSLFSLEIGSTEVAVLSLGVFLAVVGGVRVGILQGLRRVRSLAAVNVLAAALAATIGSCAVILLGQEGLILFVVSMPLATLVFAFVVSRGNLTLKLRATIERESRLWRQTFVEGAPLMCSALAGAIMLLVIRAILVSRLGIDQAGYFQATWAISMTYVGVVLGALATDYYPRLSMLAHDDRESAELVTQQIEIALLLIGPAVLALIVFAPLVMQLLYSSSFGPAAELLRWQLLGDVFKVASWPLGFILLARGRGVHFLALELAWNLLVLGMTWYLVPLLGLLGFGVAFVVAYILYLVVMLGYARYTIGFRFEKRTAGYFALIFGCCFACAVLLPADSYFVGSIAILASTAFSLFQLDRLVDIRSLLRKSAGQSGDV
ncbi:MAG: O-antigen translocase [Halieaceae bacterium]|nr:O-antigen translocase [Halieaceae bacterium]